MSIRLIILLIVGAILAVRFAMTSTAPPAELEDANMQTFDSDEGKSIEQIRNVQTPLWQRDIPGETPDEEAELVIRVEVDTSQGKNRMYFYITESHGYYIDTFNIDIWYVGNQEYDQDNSPLVITHRIMNKYLKVNDTLVDCLEVVPTELQNINNDIGETGYWEAEIVDWGRVREQNPDPLPVVTQYNSCES